ncbi:MoxR family ATPase [Bacteriovoracaceae bacterium]|nr:MoxR family ATPase [Bacteriovoracaceae bacterium]
MNSSATGKIESILNEANKVILGKNEEIKIILATWIVGGHVLLEDLPGTGKTMLAKALSQACHVKFTRAQFTPDLLPSDILGNTIYDQEKKKFYFRRGPLFTDFFLADEINRATPRTQSALLESMAENQITIENHTTKLSDNFFVVATQNPIEQQGTFPLPEAQLDRFMIKISLGFLSNELEIKMIKDQIHNNPLAKVIPVVEGGDLIQLRNQAKSIAIDPSVLEYIVNIAEASRNHPNLKHGISPRASLAFTKLAQGYSLVQNRNYVIPSDVFKLAKPVMCHRISLTEDALFDGHSPDKIIEEILHSVPSPKLDYK